MNELSALSSVVFPEPVPPEISMFSRACTQPASRSTISVVSAPFAISCSIVSLRAESADREDRSVERQRRNDRVDARAVGQDGRRPSATTRRRDGRRGSRCGR